MTGCKSLAMKVISDQVIWHIFTNYYLVARFLTLTVGSHCTPCGKTFWAFQRWPTLKQNVSRRRAGKQSLCAAGRWRWDGTLGIWQRCVQESDFYANLSDRSMRWSFGFIKKHSFDVNVHQSTDEFYFRLSAPTGWRRLTLRSGDTVTNDRIERCCYC